MSDEPENDRLDLSAWEAPPPPAELADQVIARVAGAVVASAPESRAPRRRGWVIASIAVAAIAAAAGVLLIARGTHRAAPASGSVIADQARSLSLDSVRADLDPGAHVAWHRESGSLQVSQRAGTVAWRVTGDDRLVIDAGATVASVEATGASLRVEVKMNQTDARTIGVTALTAAAVSLVTVVVYEGHVKVGGSHGQPTVIVQPGSTYTVTPPTTRLVEPPIVGASPAIVADLRITAGESATIHVAAPPLSVQLDMPDGCTLFVGDTRQMNTAVTLDEGVHPYRLDCKIASQTGQSGALTVVVDTAQAPVAAENADGPVLRIDQIEWSDDRTFIRGQATPRASLSTSGIDWPVLDGFFVVALPPEQVASLRLEHVKRGVHYFVLRKSQAVAAGPRTVGPPCDAAKLRDQAIDRTNLGQHAAALVLYERALACKPGDAGLTRLAFMSACNALDQPKANKLFQKLSVADRAKYKGICGRNQIDVDDGTASCDAEASKEKGMSNINKGQHAAALSEFEASLRCKDDPYVRQLAFMEACASSNAAKANLYYARLSKQQREKFRQICIRQKPPVELIEPDDSPGYLQIKSKPEAKVLIDGVDTGLTTPVSGTDLPLQPGKHKVTFVIGEDRFTYPVVIEAGQTATMTKDLQ